MDQDFAKEVRLATPPGAVWSALLDFQRVASWLPIVGELREIEPMRRYSTVLEDRMGPFALRADLTVSVVTDPEARRLHVSASGEDRQVASRISATLDVAVSDEGGGSAVSVTGRYEIIGRVATLGAGAIRKKGERVLDDLFARLARELGAVSLSSPGDPSPSSSARGDPPGLPR